MNIQARPISAYAATCPFCQLELIAVYEDAAVARIEEHVRQLHERVVHPKEGDLRAIDIPHADTWILERFKDGHWIATTREP